MNWQKVEKDITNALDQDNDNKITTNDILLIT